MTAQKIESIRQKEVSHLIHYHLLRMINIYITYVAPLIVPYVLFYVYIYLGGKLITGESTVDYVFLVILVK